MKFKATNIVLVALVLGAAYILIFTDTKPGTTNSKNIKIPAFSQQAREGEVLFNANCSRCHGKNAAGTDKGPTFLSEIYNPGHHPDGSFYYAANKGVIQHHWRFGNMPPRPEVSAKDVAKIIKYIRELQLANGIVYQEHRM
ncbi:MAG: cytochrome c [Alphaproteobacteria bacterium]|nr:cytochrome c [Alphaproteobacteria bacterium]